MTREIISMRAWFTYSITAIAAVAISVLALAVTPTSGQGSSTQIPRMPDRKPNLTGLWQALGTAYWDIQDHSAQAGPFFQLGATGAIPAGQAVVDGNEIPYQPWALEKKKENLAGRLMLDPEIKCYLPGVPRATYMPFPFQIIQSQTDLVIAYEYRTANRVINVAKPREATVDSWMGTSNGRWDGDTLVVDVTGLNGQSWFDRAGNFASENVHIVERYTLVDADHLNYEATIEDKTVFTRPWKIRLPLYRRKEPNARLLEFKCVEFTEELLYGHLRKQTAR
jgi:hypothetical protein